MILGYTVVHGSVFPPQKSNNNMHCSHNFPTAVNVSVDARSSVMQPCNKLAAGPGCNPAFTPGHLRLDPGSPHPSAVKENRGTVEDFSARSRSKQNNGAIRNHKVQPGFRWSSSVFFHSRTRNICCRQIKVRNGMRHRGCEGCALLLRSGREGRRLKPSTK